MENVIDFKQAREKIAEIKKNTIKTKKTRQASENRIKFGLKKSIKDLNKQEQEKLTVQLEGHKVTDPDDKSEA